MIKYSENRRKALVSALLVLSNFFTSVAEDVKHLSDKQMDIADKELNLVYQDLLAVLDSIQVNKLRLSQRHWLLFRDAESSLRAGITSGGSSSYSTDYVAVRIELTKERTSQLKQMRSLLAQ